MIDDIFHSEKEAFKINASLGYILRNQETGFTKYWYQSQNNYTLLDTPVLFKNIEDIQQLMETSQSVNISL